MPGERLRRATSIMLALGLLASCSTRALPTPTPAPLPTPSASPTVAATRTTPAAIPRFDTSVCPFALPAGEVPGTTVDCGYLIVPERRDALQGPTVRLAVARFRALDGNVDGGPWVYVAGGWGNPVQGLVSHTTGSFRSEATTHHDFILYDQRGVGLSQPSLACPELGDAVFAAYQQPASAGSGVPPPVAAAAHCRDRLVQQGIDLTAYTSVEDAADLNDLRVVLGYRQLNLSGISYGTVRALTVLRDFPDAVRSVVLDATAPLQANLITDWGGDFDRALRLLFARCAAESRCHSTYPTLESDFSQVVTQLNAAPASITITDPTSGQRYPLVITGARLVSLTFDGLYTVRTLATLPATIAQLKQGNDAQLTQLAGTAVLSARATQTAREFAILCSESIPYAREDEAIGRLDQVLPVERDTSLAFIQTIFAICAYWPVKLPSARAHQPVTSTTPALVLQSANDPVTPPTYGQEAAKTLSKSFYVETPGVGHGVWTNDSGDCVLPLMLRFMDDPARQPDTSCTAGLGFFFQTSY